ncbi:MAG TPA: FAD-dependent oxidoreductase [Pseudolysinimonas sp.]|jgi:succinate dehydrogenase/fumarate reductase flavoprotein subunit
MTTELPTTWSYEADVVVVGGGNAGLPAAISAHDAGASTLIVENNAFLGGLMRGSGGFMSFCATHVHDRNGVEDRVEWGIEDEMRLCEHRAVPEIVEAYVGGGRATCLWLEELGLVFSDELRNPAMGFEVGDARAVPRTHYAAVSPSGYYPGGSPKGENGFALTSVLEKAVTSRGIRVLSEHRMRHIFREPGGRVIGIRAETADGLVDIRARRAVILASGGATANEALVKAWDPRLVNDAVYPDGLPYMTAMGDAYVAGLEVGAGLSDMSFVSFLAIRYGSHYYSLSLSRIAGEEGIARVTGIPMAARKGAYQRIALLRGRGGRYIDESVAAQVSPGLIRDSASLPLAEYPEEPFNRTFLSLPDPKNVWAVTDAPNAEAMGWPIEEMAAPDPMHGRALHPDSVAISGTIAELAEKIGMDPELVERTMRRYNEGAKEGIDPDFGKRDYEPIADGPFFAAKLNMIRHTPPGGLRINATGQVLDHSAMWDARVAAPLADEPVIGGLYAAGEAAAFVGFRRSHRKTGPIITMGRIAGSAAAAEPASD